MEPVYVIEDLSQLRAVSDPLRLEVLHVLSGEARTTASIAEAVGSVPSKLYYHLSELERVGLVRVVERTRKGNLIEKHYQSVAATFVLDRGLLNRAPAGGEPFYWRVADVLDEANQDLERSLREDRVEEDAAVTVHRRVRVEAGDLAHFRERLEALLAEFAEPETPDSGSEGKLTVIFYR
jgi:DNA-binding transcriptional ArsR family regulator